MRYVLGHQVKNGADSHKWRGGRWRHKSGYIYVYVPEHPHANRDGYVLEHRLVMEQILGRFLVDKECVHHRNQQRDDNRPENLVLYASRSDHQRTEHRDGLVQWQREYPERASECARLAGLKGAAVRWQHPPNERDTLAEWRRANPEQAARVVRRAGLKGASVRWGREYHVSGRAAPWSRLL